MHDIGVFIARETQDFASLQARAIVVIDGMRRDIMRRQAKVETQNLASHKGGCVIN